MTLVETELKTDIRDFTKSTEWLESSIPGVSNRWKSMIGKPIDQSISINKISELVSIGIGQSMINR